MASGVATGKRREGRSNGPSGRCRPRLTGHRLAAAMAMVLGVPAAAQVVPPSDRPTGIEIDPGRVFGDDRPLLGGLGFLSAFGVNISANMRTEYSDNMVRLSDQQALPPSYQSRADWRFQPNVIVAAAKPIGRQQIFVNGILGRTFYARNTILDSNRFQIDGGLRWSAGTRCGGDVRGGWSTRETQFDLFNEVIPSRQDSTNFTVSAGCQSPVGISPSISYNYSRSDNDLESRNFADVRSNSLSGRLSYALAGRGDVGISGFWSNSRYPFQILDDGSENSTEIYGFTVSGNYRVGPSLRTTAGIGYTKAKPKSPNSDDFSGTNWNLGLIYSGPRLGAGLSAGRSISSSSGGFANFQVLTSYQADVSYQVGERIRTSAGFVRSEISNRGLENLPDEGFLQDYSNNRWFGAVDYRLNRTLSLGFDLSHQSRSSDQSVFNYNATSAAFTIRARF